MAFHVYVIRNPDGKLYIGQTDRLEWRLQQHNDPAHTLTRTTQRFLGPWTLVYCEEFASRSEALARSPQKAQVSISANGTDWNLHLFSGSFVCMCEPAGPRPA